MNDTNPANLRLVIDPILYERIMEANRKEPLSDRLDPGALGTLTVCAFDIFLQGSTLQYDAWMAGFLYGFQIGHDYVEANGGLEGAGGMLMATLFDPQPIPDSDRKSYEAGADLQLLERLRGLVDSTPVLAGLTNAQQKAIITVMIESFERLQHGQDHLPGFLGGVALGFKMGHDYSTRYAPLWIPPGATERA